MAGKILRSLAAATVIAVAFSSCKRPFSDREQNNRTYRHSEAGAPIAMDPVTSSTAYENLMVTTIYDQLYEYKYLARPYALKPRLATGMPEVSEDGLVYIYRIKQGVYYTDDPCFPDGKGRELVVQDFIYSMKRMFDPTNLPQGEWVWRGKIKGLDEWKEAGSDYSKDIEGLKAIDNYTLQITLNEPFPQLTYTLAMGYSSIVPREAVEHYGKEFSLNPVGSGPYKLESFSTRKAVFSRNEKYREEYFNLEDEGYDPATQAWTNVELIEGMRLPILDNVEVHFMEENMTRWNSLNKGNEIHYGGIPVELARMVASELNPLKLRPEYAEKFTGMTAPQFGFIFLPINMEDPKIGYHPDPEQARRNLLLRKAIRAAYDWDQRNERFYNDIGVVFPGIIPPGLDAHDPNLSRDYVTVDYERAKEYLREGGWTPENLPELTYGGVASVANKQFFEQFRGWMEKIGYPREKIVLKTYATFGDYNRAVRNKELSFSGGGWGLDYPDSENVLQLFYGPNKSPGSNASNYDNPEFNELFRRTKTMQPGPERTKLYRKMNEILLEDVPTISGLVRNDLSVWHKDVVFLPSNSPHGSLLKYVYLIPEEQTAEAGE
ncbi:MAG: ABC transporter substrate-binding protein [Opitutales bacterium]